ncbi:D-Ala-D-Ala carboxypeptidase [Salinimicrobium marinum]|uniref:D-Ala-D-Ala carboxypeptidase n=1 Tax=Salinimicrobium marinum TaxID=680283 RepID=A0A918W0I9_9FLAO|nr:serine hydrolase domain-containing protein [Salinimicrobium marinum]GHA42692.1 D-Ala-D-Ala carboxypeptidase [Salinimicrobium marinum]
MKKIIFCNLFLIAFSLSAQDIDMAKMDSLFAVVEENQKGMGSVTISKYGEIIYQNSIGFSDLDNQVRNTENTKFRIGSISKTFTAAVIMQLVEEGKLQLDTKLAEFFPDIPNAFEITVEDLLRHQSGLFNFTNKKEYLEYLEESKTKEELLEIFIANGTVSKPGEKNEYSNTNYVLLSFIAEDVDSSSLKDILEKRIVAPLQLQNTYFGGKINTANSEAFSYRKKGKWIPTSETDTSIPMGAGGVVSTPSDLTTFFTALFSGEVVKPEMLEEMKAMPNKFGIGLFSYPFADKIFYGHDGGIDGFSSIAIYNPEDGLSVAYLSNAGEFSINDMLRGVLSIYYEENYDIPEFATTIDIPAEELEKFTGTYSSEGFPLKLSIFAEEGVLMGQGSGQPPFPLEAYAQNKFQYAPADLKLEFFVEEDKVIVLQAGNSTELTREVE